jgi:hypothetical protein
MKQDSLESPLGMGCNMMQSLYGIGCNISRDLAQWAQMFGELIMACVSYVIRCIADVPHVYLWNMQRVHAGYL